MKKTLMIQKTTAILYVISSIVTLCYALAFMTEYKDLFGLKLKQNEQVAIFHDAILQTFNRQILAWAVFGAVVILLAFLLQIFSKVPDRFAIIVMGGSLLGCCYGAFYSITNLVAIQKFYLALDLSSLELEGVLNFGYKLTTLYVGKGIYVLHMLICTAVIVALIASNLQYKKLLKKG